MKTVWPVSLQVQQRTTIWASISTPSYLPSRNKNTHLHKNLSMNVHKSINHNNPKVETTPKTISWQMYKSDLVYLYNGILWNIDICCNTDDLENVMWKFGHKRPHITWFHLYGMFKKAKSIETKSRLMASRTRRGMGSWPLMGMGFLFGVRKMFWTYW